MVVLQRLSSPDEQDIRDLGELLRDSVAGGASVNFVHVPSPEVACDWWRKALRDDAGVLIVARDERNRIIGCVRLMPAPQENGQHRADVGKLLVHSTARGRGVATLLMQELEVAAREAGRTLLILDTESGSYAERFYAKRGWVEFGRLAGHTVNPAGQPSATTYFAKNL